MQVSGARRNVGGVPVWPIGLGTASMSVAAHISDELSIRAIEAGMAAGITLIDTSLAYSTVADPGHSEKLVRRALASAPDRDNILLVSKGGHFRVSASEWAVDNSPATLRRHCESSLDSLGVSCIDLYLLHHPDPLVPVADSLAALAALRDEGKIRCFGVSNVSLDQLREVLSITPVDAVQNRFSPFDLAALPTLAACEEAGVAFLAYSPLGGRLGNASLRSLLPLTAALCEPRGISLPQLILAWSLRQGKVVVPISGATRPSTAVDSAAAATVSLSDAEWAIADSELLALRKA